MLYYNNYLCSKKEEEIQKYIYNLSKTAFKKSTKTTDIGKTVEGNIK
jgi:hypothetical protein